MLVMNKVHTLLFPIDLKKYMVVSFGIIWTLGLTIALIASLIHQINFQNSTDKIYLELELAELQQDLNVAHVQVQDLHLSIKNTQTAHEGSIKSQWETITKQNVEIKRGIYTIKSLRDFYSYIIDTELLYYPEIMRE